MEKSESFNVSKAVKDYSSSVEELEKITTEITKTASDGLPISEELRSKLNKELDGLKTHYTNLCEKAHKISKDIPENPSIYDLQKIIEEYDKISSELSEIKEILTKFIRVTSKEPKYADAIRPYQDKARDIVEQIDNKTVGKEIVSSDTCKGAKCFTNALDNAMDNKNYADLDEETRDSLENIFKPKVISGLAANKYFLPPDKNHAESDDSAENKVVESEPEPVPVVETKKENKPNQRGLMAHFRSVAEASPVPVVIYNVPGRTGVNISAETTLALATECPNIIGIKEASGNMQQVMEILRNRPDGFRVISGDDALTCPMIAMGADGVISVIANALPKETSDMVRFALKGDMKKALPLHYRLLPLMNAIFDEGNPTGIKALLETQGMIYNVLRLPLVKASKQLTNKLTTLYNDFRG